MIRSRYLKYLVIGLLFMVTNTPVTAQVAVWEGEAENGSLVGTAAIDSDCGNASGGEFVRLKGDAGNAVVFDNLSVPAAGTYQLNIHYFYNSERVLEVFVNGASQGIQNLPAAHWCYQGLADVYSMNIDLNEGSNALRLQVANGEIGPFVDKVSVTDQDHIYLSVGTEKTRLIQGDSTLLTVKASSAVSQEVSAGLSVSGLTASEYHLKDESVTISAGTDETTTWFSVPDNTLDVNKTAIIRLGTPSGDARVGYPDSVAIDVFEDNKAYYVSTSNGDDARAGTSPSTAWKTLAKVSASDFLPGDSILFKKGDEFVGQLQVPSSGNEGAPIVIASYGDGEKPVLNGAGADGGDHMAAILVNNQDHMIIQDLELTNDRQVSRSGVSDNDAYGIYILNDGYEVMQNLVMKHLTIRDIFSISTEDEFNQIHVAGIGMHTDKNTEVGKAKHIRDVLVDSCYITRTTRYGIRASHAGANAGVGNDTLNHNMNLLFRDNHTFEIGGSGVQIGRGYNCLVEGNTFEYSGSDVDPRMAARGSGAWFWTCKNLVAQYNKCLHARGYADSYGMHIDFGNENVFFQYNYSEDSEGGFVEILGDNKNVGYRFNVSVNDGLRTNEEHPWVPGSSIWVTRFAGQDNKIPSDSVYVYNNTIYVDADIQPDINIKASNTFVYNNIFYASGSGMIGENVEVEPYDNGVIDVDNNLFFGDVPSTFYELDPNALLKSPQLAKPGTKSIDGYKLLEDSPAIQAGKTFPQPQLPMAGKGIFQDVSSEPQTDLYGTAVDMTEGSPGIGAYNGEGVADTSTSLQDFQEAVPLSLVIQPNPVESNLHLSMRAEHPGKVRMLVTDLQGRLIDSRAFYLTQGRQEVSMDLDARVTNGIYLLVVKGEGFSLTRQFILVR